MLPRIFTEPQEGASYDTLLKVAKATQELGFDAFFRSDHYFAIMGENGLPGPADAWLSLAGLARESSRIRLDTLGDSRDVPAPRPARDQRSPGRRDKRRPVELGLGAGWYDTEHAAYGIPYPGTKERFEEQIKIAKGPRKASGPSSFKGEHYQLTESPRLPKPVQTPGPPVIVGRVGAKRTPRLAAR